MATLFSTIGTFLTLTLLTYSAQGQQPSPGPKKVPSVTNKAISQKKRPVTSRAVSTNSSADQQRGPWHNWIKVAPFAEEFTVRMPHSAKLEIQPDALNRNELVRTYSTSDDGGIYMVTSKSRTHPSDVSDQALLNSVASEYKNLFFKSLGENGGEGKIIEERNLILDGSFGREYQFLMGETPGVSRIYVTKRHLYTLIWMNIVIADLPGEAHPYWFLDSFRLGKLNNDQASRGVRKNTAERDSLIASELGVAVGGKLEERSSGNGDTHKAVILSKPEPTYTESAKRNQVAGTVVLRVLLHASAHVRGIQVVRGLPYGLTETAIAAARRIEFKPATKDGRAVSQFMIVEYNFNPY